MDYKLKPYPNDKEQYLVMTQMYHATQNNLMAKSSENACLQRELRIAKLTHDELYKKYEELVFKADQLGDEKQILKGEIERYKSNMDYWINNYDTLRMTHIEAVTDAEKELVKARETIEIRDNQIAELCEEVADYVTITRVQGRKLNSLKREYEIATKNYNAVLDERDEKMKDYHNIINNQNYEIQNLQKILEERNKEIKSCKNNVERYSNALKQKCKEAEHLQALVDVAKDASLYQERCNTSYLERKLNKEECASQAKYQLKSMLELNDKFSTVLKDLIKNY